MVAEERPESTEYSDKHNGRNDDEDDHLLAMDQLVKLPNHVAERQRFYQNHPAPLYVRAPRARLYNSVWFSGLFVGLAGITYGAVHLVLGKPSE